MIEQDRFTVLTRQKGKIYDGRVVKNNSTHLVFYDGVFVGQVRTKSDAKRFIDNLVKYNKLEFTEDRY